MIGKLGYSQPNYRDSLEIAGDTRPVRFCPITTCPMHIKPEDEEAVKDAWAQDRMDRARGWRSRGDQTKHMNEHHLAQGDGVPIEWLGKYKKVICPVCTMSCRKPKPGQQPGLTRCIKAKNNLAAEVTFEEIWNSNPRINRQIPAPCLSTFTAIRVQYEEQYAAGVEPAATEALKRLYAMPKMVLLKPKRTGRRFRGYLAKLVGARLTQFAEGKLGHLWGHVHDSVQDKQRDKLTAREEEARRIKRVRQMFRDGDESKGAAALLLKGMAPLEPDIKQQMRQKHPQQERPACDEELLKNVQPMQVRADDTLHALKRLRWSSGAGPSGFRPSHARQIARSKCGRGAQAAIRGPVDARQPAQLRDRRARDGEGGARRGPTSTPTRARTTTTQPRHTSSNRCCTCST